MILLLCDFSLMVDFLCGYNCCDLSLSALLYCISALYLLEGVNGHMVVKDFTDRSAIFNLQSSVFVQYWPVTLK